LRATGETETTQENIQGWLELDEGDPGFQLIVFSVLNKGSTLIFFISTIYINTFSIRFLHLSFLSFKVI
jgi:hypothetical protein